MFGARLSSAVLLLLTSLTPILAATASTPCNNSPSLCSRAYNNVTYLGAHDSPFLRPSLAGDQYYNSTAQLSAGVRLLTAQIYTTNATAGLQLCHTECDLLDAGRLSTWLAGIKTWLDANPNDVVTILLVNGNGASTASIAAEYADANIRGYTYTPDFSLTTPGMTQTWPTLQSMISMNTRLVTFVASLVDDYTAAPYLMNEFDHVFENNYNYTAPNTFSCQPQRPSSVANNYPAAQSAGLMPLMNHFVYTSLLPGVDVPDEADIYQTNAPSGSANCTGSGCLGTTAQQCAGQYGRAPSFVLVDFFNVGPAIQTVDVLNGVTDPVGRTSLSTVAAVPAGGNGSSSSSASVSGSATMASGTATGTATSTRASGTAAASAAATSHAAATRPAAALSDHASVFAAVVAVFAGVLFG